MFRERVRVYESGYKDTYFTIEWPSQWLIHIQSGFSY